MPKKNKSKRVKRAKLIVNPVAGKPLEEDQKIKYIVETLGKNNIKVDVALAKPKREATPLAKRAVKNGYKLIIAMGGDGTIEEVIRGVIGSKARLGIIPAGGENNVAKSLGIPETLEEACALIVSKKPIKVDVGQLKTKKGKKFYFFEIATVGLSASIYPDALKVADGNLASIKDTVMTFLHHETKPEVFLTINNESKVKVNTMLVVISNTPIFGKGFLVAPQASLQDGLLDISIYPDFSKAELLRYFASVMDQGGSGDKKVQHYQAQKIVIKTSPKLDLMADGIILGKGKVKIKICPRALRVIANYDQSGVGTSQKNEAQAQPAQPAPPTEQSAGNGTAVKVGEDAL